MFQMILGRHSPLLLWEWVRKVGEKVYFDGLFDLFARLTFPGTSASEFFSDGESSQALRFPPFHPAAVSFPLPRLPPFPLVGSWAASVASETLGASVSIGVGRTVGDTTPTVEVEWSAQNREVVSEIFGIVFKVDSSANCRV